MSLLTSGSSLYSRMPFSPLAAASSYAAFTSPADAGCFSVATKSVTEPVGVGTRIAMPFSLPLSSGSTMPTALAAPVEVGIMFTAPARARRMSE